MEIKLPDNAHLEMQGGEIRVKMGGEEHSVKYNSRKLNAQVKAGALEIMPIRKMNRETSAAIHSIAKHLKNIFIGVGAPYQKVLQVVYAHFPVSVEVKGKEILIKNFLGEKLPRKAEIRGKAQVQVSGQEITVKGANKEDVGQTAANIMQAVRIVGKDRRVFQDGIYKSE